MFRTLLVDDDFLVRSYLKTLDSWERAGYEIIRDVQDGEEALCAIEEEPVDVVVTDISMPVMDGIELIRRIRETNRGIYILVLSCHDDFTYVKEAMKLGADEYVLKNSLDENSLYEILEKAARLIEKQRQKSSEQERTRKLIKMGSHALKYYFFNGLISGTLRGAQREEKRLEAGIQGRFFNSAVIHMFLEGWSEQKPLFSPVEAEQYSHYFRHRLTEQIEELLGEERDSAEVIYLGAGIFCCFLDLSALHRTSQMRQRLTDAAFVCFRFCREEPYAFGIGVSSVCMGEDGIRQAYQQAREMVKLHFYESEELLYYDCQREIADTLPQSARELEQKMESLKNGHRQKELEQLWERVLADCQREYPEGRLLLSWLRRLDKLAGLKRSPEFYNGIVRFEELCRIGQGYGKELFETKIQPVPEGISGTVKYAAEFVRNHYKEPISLQDAAEAAGVNAAYLSSLFKQEMKIGFSNYLQECRLECAKELLTASNCKVKEAAALAGFHDYHYFAKSFKKRTGQSPADYRRLYGWKERGK